MVTCGSDVESGDGETTTFDGVSRVGGAREAGFVETRGVEDRFGRGATRGMASGRAGGETAMNGVSRVEDEGEGKTVINSKFKIPV